MPDSPLTSTDEVKADQTRPIVTSAEVADLIHSTEGALAQDRYLGRGIPYIKHGRRVLYRMSDVLAYLDENTVRPNGAA